jgi:hypothetical protein
MTTASCKHHLILNDNNCIKTNNPDSFNDKNKNSNSSVMYNTNSIIAYNGNINNTISSAATPTSTAPLTSATESCKPHLNLNNNN